MKPEKKGNYKNYSLINFCNIYSISNGKFSFHKKNFNTSAIVVGLTRLDGGIYVGITPCSVICRCIYLRTKNILQNTIYVNLHTA